MYDDCSVRPAAYKMNDSDFMRTALEIMDEVSQTLPWICSVYMHYNI